jgi:NADPH:quinone reductase-like Zn-dependent oxidoreductase
MKAILYTTYGPPNVLQLQEIEKPTPKENEVLVRVHASSVNALDWRPFTFPTLFVRLMRGGLRTPENKSIGTDIAGRVEAVGANVTQFQPGDEVFGVRRGAFSEYVCAPESLIARKPRNISFEEAAAVPVAALTALLGLRDKGNIQPGQKVLICGAGGGVGTFAVQIAKFFGAEVTAVCGTHNLNTARSIGADHVIDYTKADFTTNGQSYDLIAAVNGYHSLRQYKRSLKPNGTCVMLGGSMAQLIPAMFLGSWLFRRGNKKLHLMMTKPSAKDLAFLSELLETGKVVPVIDRTYPLEKAAEAIGYLLQGHARGKVVIRCQ